MATSSPMGDNVLPGETGPLPMRPRGVPVTDEEALGVARRLARRLAETARSGSGAPVPDALPADEPLVHATYKVSPRTLTFVRARAEMESTTVSAVVSAALRAYAEGNPGTTTVFETWRPEDA